MHQGSATYKAWLQEKHKTSCFPNKHFQNLPIKIRSVLTPAHAIKSDGEGHNTTKKGHIPLSSSYCFNISVHSAYPLRFSWAGFLGSYYLVWPAFPENIPIISSAALYSSQTELYSIYVQTLLLPPAFHLIFIFCVLKCIPSPFKTV